MNNSEKLHNQLLQLLTALFCNAWFGQPVNTIIDGVGCQNGYQQVPGQPHTIAQILTHMLAWLEEAISRMQGNAAGAPQRGDWPDVEGASLENWQQLVDKYKQANAELSKLVAGFPQDEWPQSTNDVRGRYTGDELSYKTLVTGLVQHHVYHAGQISLLYKLNNGK